MEVPFYFIFNIISALVPYGDRDDFKENLVKLI